LRDSIETICFVGKTNVILFPKFHYFCNLFHCSKLKIYSKNLLYMLTTFVCGI